LWLYYTAQKPDTPKWAKTAIYAALAYFVLPLDAIPDFIPGIGYSDDVSILASALLSVSLYLDASVKQQATEKLSVWFGDREE
ncbi:MAG: YkvA family protein, partial [Plesiomonas shigelloides]